MLRVIIPALDSEKGRKVWCPQTEKNMNRSDNLYKNFSFRTVDWKSR